MDDKVIAALLGFGAGVLGTFFAPWINWGIEKRRLRFQNRRETIARWRAVLAHVMLKEEWADAGELTFALSQHPDFMTLKRELPQVTADLLDNADCSDTALLEALNAAIDAQEKRWNLL